MSEKYLLTLILNSDSILKSTQIPYLRKSKRTEPIMRTILVTGGAGFIGGEFVRQLYSDKSNLIINLDKLTYAGNLASLGSINQSRRHIFHQGDIGDSPLVRSLFEHHKPDAVVNFAAESHVDRSIDNPGEFIETNVVGTFRLLEEARNYWSSLDAEAAKKFRFLHVSTDEVYGSLGTTGKFEETTPYAPNSPYSASKAASDHLVRAYFHTYGLPTLTTNCSNNYGPFQFPEKLIPLMILNCISGKQLPVYGDGQQVRDWLFVADHCEAIRTVLERGRIGEVYNIGGDCERANIDVVKAIGKAVDSLIPGRTRGQSEKQICYVKDRPGHDRRYAIDFSKIRNELGWKPRRTFEEHLTTTVQWYLNNSDWLESIHSQNDITKRRGLAVA